MGPPAPSVFGRVSGKGRSNSYTKEEALFPLSNDSRACVAMAAGCSFLWAWCVCVCSLFAQGVAQHYLCSCSSSVSLT